MDALDTGHAIHRLEQLGLVRRGGGMLCTTSRWQAAMARSALRMMALGDDGTDLRVPVASALLELLPGHDLDELTHFVLAMAIVEAREMGARTSSVDQDARRC